MDGEIHEFEYRGEKVRYRKVYIPYTPNAELDDLKVTIGPLKPCVFIGHRVRVPLEADEPFIISGD